jgi:hypothetical protein
MRALPSRWESDATPPRPLKSTASNAILTLPPFAVQALRRHRRQQHRLRLASGQPATVGLRWVEPGQPPRPVELDLVFRTERGTAVNPNHASRAFARLAASVGLAAHPHLLRHALASAMAANKEPASIIAAQLRHADGGALAQRVYIHQLPQDRPRLAGVIEGVFGPAARGRAVSAGRRAEGKWMERSTLEPDLIGGPRPHCCWSEPMWQGQDSNLCRHAGDFTGRIAVSPRVPFHRHLVPIIARDVQQRPGGSFGRHLAFPPVPSGPARPASGGGKSERNPGRL